MPYRLAIPQYSTDDIIANFFRIVNSFGKKNENITNYFFVRGVDRAYEDDFLSICVDVSA